MTVAGAVGSLDLPADQVKALHTACREVATYGRKMVDGGLVVGSAGNVSVRIGDFVVISPSSMDYEAITEEDVCVMDGNGCRIAGAGRASSEYPMHRAVYAISPAQAVIHTHSRSAAAVSTVCDELPAIHYSILRLGGPSVRVAPYQTFGSDNLASSAVAALEGRCAALLQNHGAIAYGATLAEAYGRAELIEWLADVWLRGRQAGVPRILSEQELEAVAEQARRRRYAGGQ